MRNVKKPKEIFLSSYIPLKLAEKSRKDNQVDQMFDIVEKLETEDLLDNGYIDRAAPLLKNRSK